MSTPGSPTPRPRPKHLMDPNNPRPTNTQRHTSITTVQRWVMSVLVVTTIAHLSVGVVAAAFTIEEDRPAARAVMLGIAGIFGIGAVAAGPLIHGRSPWTWFLPLGLLPSIVGAYFLF